MLDTKSEAMISSLIVNLRMPGATVEQALARLVIRLTLLCLNPVQFLKKNWLNSNLNGLNFTTQVENERDYWSEMTPNEV
jgi:hypothetical protein